MKDKDKKAEDIEVIEPKIVKAKKVKIVKWTFKEDVGTVKGKPRFVKGKSYELTKEQIDNCKKQNLICQI